MPEADIDLSILTLDRSRHISKVFPPERGAHFEQDGIYFGADGRLAPEFITDALKAKLRRMAARRFADQEAEKARRAALIQAGLDPDAPDTTNLSADIVDKIANGAAGADDNDGDVDLIAFLQGTKKYQKRTWMKAAREKYNRDVTTTADLADFMIENGLIKEDQINIRLETR